MTKSKSSKKALLASLLSLVLCFAMLIGSTFAWFTDSVTSGINKITAGNLDVELEYAKFNDDGTVKEWVPVDAATNLFMPADGDGAALWEPGHTEYVCLRVRNAGSLALKYQFAVNPYGTTGGAQENTYTSTVKDADGNYEKFKLSQYLVFNQIDGKAEKVNDRKDLWLTAAEEAAAIGKMSELGKSGVLMPKGKETEAVPSEQILTLAVYMPTSVDNHANQLTSARTEEGAPTLFLGLELAATQTPYENDSFGNTYDENVDYPLVPTVNVETEATITSEAQIIKLEKVNVDGVEREFSISIPAGAVDADTDVTFSVVQTSITDKAVTYDISLKDADGNPVTLQKEAEVTIYIPSYVDDVKVAHSGTPMADGTYTYTPADGSLTIRTTSFSPFAITYEPDYTIEDEGGLKVILERGGEITLVENVTITTNGNNPTIVNVAEGTTLDMQNLTISSPNMGLILLGKNITIKNGNFTALNGDAYALFVGDAGETDNVVIENVTMNGGINVFNASNVILRNCEIHGTMYRAVWADFNAHIIIESGTYYKGKVNTLEASDADPSQGAPAGSITVTGGSYSDNPEAFIDPNLYGVQINSEGMFEVLTKEDAAAVENGNAYRDADGNYYKINSKDESSFLLDHAYRGGEATLIKNIGAVSSSWSSKQANYSNKQSVLDLNDHTYTFGGLELKQSGSSDGASLTVKNGTMIGSATTKDLLYSYNAMQNVILDHVAMKWNDGRSWSPSGTNYYGLNLATNTSGSVFTVKDSVIDCNAKFSATASSDLAVRPIANLTNTTVNGRLTGQSLIMNVDNCTVNGEVYCNGSYSSTTTVNISNSTINGNAFFDASSSQKNDVTITDTTINGSLQTSSTRNNVHFTLTNVTVTGTLGYNNSSWKIPANKVTIVSGTYGFDPTNYLAAGSTVAQNTEGMWVVTAG